MLNLKTMIMFTIHQTFSFNSLEYKHTVCHFHDIQIIKIRFLCLSIYMIYCRTVARMHGQHYFDESLYVRQPNDPSLNVEICGTSSDNLCPEMEVSIDYEAVNNVYLPMTDDDESHELACEGVCADDHNAIFDDVKIMFCVDVF